MATEEVAMAYPPGAVELAMESPRGHHASPERAANVLRAARHSAEMGVSGRDLAREALDGLFRRRVEAEKVYCSPCLVVRQLGTSTD
jgi:hypothetical protein